MHEYEILSLETSSNLYIFAPMIIRLFKHKPLKQVIIFLLLTALHIPMSHASAQTEADHMTFSLLTCAPGDKIYTLFGHTAIRYKNVQKGIDDVYNYGVFSFHSPNFIWRFVKGETDYRLGVMDFAEFRAGYAYEKRVVWEQTLNLTAAEKSELLKLLKINLLPANKVYRYNFFFDNCATRPRDKIEESIEGNVIYTSEDYRQSFRDIVHEGAKDFPWDRFGMDFCLGVKADHPITYREEMFSPIYLMEAFNKARIINDKGEERPLISHTKEIVSQGKVISDAQNSSLNHFISASRFTPIRLSLLLFIIITYATIFGIRRNKSLWGIDLALFVFAGIAGSVIAFLTGFSEHPTVSPNYLLFVFHPLHLLLAPFFLYKEVKHRRSRYHQINLIVLTLFIVVWPLNPQHFDFAVLPLALCLLVRSFSNLVLTYNKKK